MAWPERGLYRTTAARPASPDTVPAESLVYLGRKDGAPFVVRPHLNERNRWFWREPVQLLAGEADEAWAATLIALPTEGYYTLPRTLDFDGGGRWLENAIVQLGYDLQGKGIIFVAERRDSWEENGLFFSDRGRGIDDTLLRELRWAPILPVADAPGGPTRH